MRRLLLVAAAVVGSPSYASLFPLAMRSSRRKRDAPGKESAPDVPDAIAVPAGLEPVLALHATGSQIYTCQAGAEGKFSWTLKGPRRN